MSIEAVKTTLPEFNFSQNVVFPYAQGAQSSTYNHYTFDSISNTNMSISLTTPGYTNNTLSRNAYKEVTVQLEYDVAYSGTGSNQYVYQSSLVCPRSWPLSSAIVNESVQINNYTNNVNSAQLVDIMTRYEDFSDYIQQGFQTITQKDDTQRYYADMVQAANSPFLGPGSTRDNQPSRNSYTMAIVQNQTVGTGGSATVKLQFTFCEPLLTPPFQYTYDNNKNLCWVNTLTLNFTFGSDLTRMFSFMEQSYAASLGFTISNIKVNVVSGQLYLKWDSLPLDSPSIPEEVVYDYNSIDVFTQTLQNTYNPDDVLTVTFNSISLRNVPQSIFIGVCKQYSRKTCYDADSYLPIQQGVSINYGNLNNQLSNLLPRDIFRIMKQNGYKQNINQSMLLYSATNKNYFCNGSQQGNYRFASAPLQLKLATDITSSDPQYLVVGSSVQATFGLQFQTINCTGTTIAANDYNTILVAVTPMRFTLSKNGNMSALDSITSPTHAMLPASSKYTHVLEGSALLGGALLGGSWWNKLKKGAIKYGKKSLPIAKDILGVVPGGEKVLRGIDIGERAYRDISGLRGSALLSESEKRALYKRAKEQRRLR